jgi:hypothetical protein
MACPAVARPRLPEDRVVDALSQIIRRSPPAALGNEMRCRVENTFVVAGQVEDTISAA